MVFSAVFKPASERTRELTARLESKIETAQADAVAAREARDKAALAVEEGIPGAVEELKQARKKLENAEKVIAESGPALEIARGRLADAEAIERGHAAQAQWEEIALLAQRRVELVAGIEKDARAMAEKFNELVRLGEEMTAAAPVKLDPNGWDPLSRSFVCDFFKVGLKKITGWGWLVKYPWPIEDAPAFADKIAEGNDWLLSKRGVQ